MPLLAVGCSDERKDCMASKADAFDVGDYVVYPKHGVGRVIELQSEEIAGMQLDLYVLRFEKERMTLRVPVNKVESIGMRKLSSDKTLKEAMETLKGKPKVKRTMWSRRAQEYEAKINSGDTYASQLLEEARGVVMASVIGMTAEQANLLLDLIEAESAKEESEFKGPDISNAPFTDDDLTSGLNFFIGEYRLKNKGPICLSCHSAPGLGGLGGGGLGPNLTRVYERLQGRVGLSAWLMAPATTTMQSVWRTTPLEAEEIHSLVALFEDRARQQGSKPTATQLTFSLFGIGGAALLLVLFGSIWQGRFRAVRRPLVHGD